LNARIPNETLDRLLLGDIVSKCYTCSKWIDENMINEYMDHCISEDCRNHACGLMVSRSNSSNGNIPNGNRWYFKGSCRSSREPASIDLTLIHYIRSKTSVIYQMEAVCLSDNCNNFSTFQQLKDALSIRPDLACLTTKDNTSTTVFTLSSTVRTSTWTATTTTSSNTAKKISLSTTTLCVVLPLFLFHAFF
jgi:hypothetical protein